MLALSVGFVIWNAALIVRGAVDRALANPLMAVLVGVAFVLLVLFGTWGEQ